jgi:trans-aconitate 2-methyltransferase
MSWDPHQYARFGGERLRPARDLVAAIPLERPARIADLGCGDGRATQLLAARWPQARIVGVDSSQAMLDAAAKLGLGAEWHRAGIDAWRPDAPFDLAFSNAAIHWLPDHAALLPRLLDAAAFGGVLAIQMPRNFSAPSHTALFDLAESAPWRERLAPLVRRKPVEEPEWYYDLLAPLSRSVEIWQTEYLHALSGDRPVVEWLKGTWLRPFLAALDPESAPAFEAEYARQMDAAYPKRADGRTLFPFRRLFVVATR